MGTAHFDLIENLINSAVGTIGGLVRSGPLSEDTAEDVHGLSRLGGDLAIGVLR